MKKKKIIIICSIVSLILIVGFILVYFFMFNNEKNTIVCEITREDETKTVYTKTVAKFDKNKRMLNYQDHVIITYKTKEAYEEGKKIERIKVDQKFNDKKMTETYIDYLWIYKYKDDSQFYSLDKYKKDRLEEGYECKID